MTAAFQLPSGPANFREAVAAEVRAHLARRRISNRRLAKMIGATPAWVDRRLNGTTVMDMDDIERIAAVLEMPPMQLITGPGTINTQPSTEPFTRRYESATAVRPTRLSLVQGLSDDYPPVGPAALPVGLTVPPIGTNGPRGRIRCAERVNSAYAS